MLNPFPSTPNVSQVDKEEMTYSYEDGDQMVFMNMETFEEASPIATAPAHPKRGEALCGCAGALATVSIHASAAKYALASPYSSP